MSDKQLFFTVGRLPGTFGIVIHDTYKFAWKMLPEGRSARECVSFQQAECLAVHANLFLPDREGYFVAVDEGTNYTPRYNVVRAPAVGDKVSRYINGDTYPDGEVTAVSQSLRRVSTSTGAVYWRRKLSSSWFAEDSWRLVHGHVTTRNESF